MPTRRQVLQALLALTAAGCAAQQPSRPVFTLRNVVAREQGRGGVLQLLGVQERHAPPYLGTFENIYFLRSLYVGKSREATHQLVVEHYYYGKEIYWDSAVDLQRRPLPVTEIVRKAYECRATGCYFAEIFGATVDEDELRRVADKGYMVQFGSRGGEQKVIWVSAAQIQAQLAACDAMKS